jgi:probable HAF family extracellular repeat protein
MANGINAAGAVVGSFIAGDGEDEHAFLYEGGEFHDLNDLIAEQGDWILVEARDINERGQVVGYGLRNGEERAVLLTPEPESEERLPAVRIVEPEQGSAFAETDAITLLAEASADAGMRRVVFYANGQAIGAANEPPFTWTWTGAPPGDCDLLAVATDSGGRMRRSARVRIMVGSVEADEAPSGDEATASGLDPSSYTPSAEPADESPALRAGVPR